MKRRLWSDESPTDAWLAFGACAWILTAIASSITLVLLFDPTAVVVAAAVVGCAASTVQSPRSRQNGVAALLAD